MHIRKLFVAITLSLAVPTLLTLIVSVLIPTVHAATAHSVDFEASLQQYLSHSDDPSFEINGDFTCEAWVKMESAGVQTICSKFASDRGYYARWRSDGPNPATENYFEVCVGNGAASCKHIFNIAQAPYVGIWTHIALVYNAATDTFEGFLNGSSVGTSPLFSVDAPGDSPAEFRIGESGANYADGLFDDVRVWNVARSGTEIAAHYMQELIGVEPGLAHYFKFNGNFADSAAGSGAELGQGNMASPAQLSEEAPTELPDGSVPPGEPTILEAVKTADEKVSGSNVLQEDDHLVLKLLPNTSYTLEGILYAANTHPSAGLVIAFAADDSNTAVDLHYTSEIEPGNAKKETGPKNAGNIISLNAASEKIFLLPNEQTVVTLNGSITTGSTGGKLMLEWAQEKSVPRDAATVLSTESFLRVVEVE